MKQKDVDFNQERSWWDGKVSQEETDLADEQINRLLRWRTIERYLKDVQTILEVGGGTGAFSIPLAQKGHKVIHVDFSAPMIEAARQKANGTPNIEFVIANAADLTAFGDRSIDLVLNMDGAVSFCGSAAEKAIAESCRVAKKTAILTVSNRAWMVPIWLSESINKLGRIVPAVYEMMQSGFWHKEQYPENDGLVSGYIGTLKAFLPEEFRTAICRNGMKVVELRAIGSLANLSADALPKVLNDTQLLNAFVDLCEEYDTAVDSSGPGTKQRAGLLAVAQW
jgi:ubiquinone/menaquinone biosynthesis C-methylase UbiE